MKKQSGINKLMDRDCNCASDVVNDVITAVALAAIVRWWFRAFETLANKTGK